MHRFISWLFRASPGTLVFFQDKGRDGAHLTVSSRGSHERVCIVLSTLPEPSELHKWQAHLLPPCLSLETRVWPLEGPCAALFS